MKVRAKRRRMKHWLHDVMRDINDHSSCYWCGRVMRPAEYELPESRTREHLIPRSKGGPKGRTNIVDACKSCNNRRGDDTNWVPYAVHRRRPGYMPPAQEKALRAARIALSA